MSTSFLGKTRLSPQISKEYHREKKQQQTNMPCWKPKSTDIETNVFSLTALCPEGSMLATCLACLSQPQFYTELFWGMAFYPYQRLGCPAIFALLPLYSHWSQPDATLRLALFRVKFQNVKHTVLYMNGACCCKIWSSSATLILKKVLYTYRSYMQAYDWSFMLTTCMSM